MINLYEILEIEKTTDKATIKKAYRELSKIHHPDVGGDPEDFKHLNKAYEILFDTEKKARYDNGESAKSILAKKENKEEVKIISTIFVEIMLKNDARSINIIDEIRKNISKKISDVSLGILKMIIITKNYNKFLEKLKHKNKKNNLMLAMAEGHIIAQNKTMDLLNKEKASFEKALELLEDFDYDLYKGMRVKFTSSSAN